MTKILLPQRKNEWRTPSQAQPKDFVGNENQTRFRMTARYHDGAVAWRGWFDDRDEADAFLFAMASGTLRLEPELWRMPSPAWDPYLDADLVYEFVTTTFITTLGSGTYNIPSDWNQFSNSVQVVAYGGDGSTGGANFAYPGGNGGGYSASTNLSLFGSISVNIASAGCWFNGASVGAATVSATTGTNTGNGSTKFNGGTAGAGDNGTGKSGGGGGAGGPHGNGNNGNSSAAIGGAGGSGDAGFGGAGSTGAGVAGSPGTEFDASHGCGGGGGGGQGGSGGTSGGLYGAGGGGSGKSAQSPGSGRQGLIVVTYTPVSIVAFNLAMNGM